MPSEGVNIRDPFAQLFVWKMSLGESYFEPRACWDQTLPSEGCHKWPVPPYLMSPKPWMVDKSALFLQATILKDLEGDGVQMPWIRTDRFKVKCQCSYADELPMQHRHGKSTSPNKLCKLNYSFITQKLLRNFMFQPLELVLQLRAQFKHLLFSEISLLWALLSFLLTLI